MHADKLAGLIRVWLVGMLLLSACLVFSGSERVGASSSDTAASAKTVEAQSGPTLYVSGSHGTDAGGCTLAASPCRTISYALAQGAAGSTLLVAESTYTENVVVANAATLKGGYEDAGWTRDIAGHQTIIDGNNLGTVVSITAPCLLEGFTVQHGSSGGGAGIYVEGAATISATVAANNSAVDWGGGLGIQDGSVVDVNNSAFRENVANYGGGIAVGDAQVTMNNLTVQDNSARINEGGIGLYYGCTATLNGVTTEGNVAAEHGGIGVYQSTATINGGVIHGNSADFNVGGLFVGESSAVLNGVTISGNSAISSTGGIGLLNGSSLVIDGSTIEDNVANERGGIEVNTSAITITNSTLMSNVASVGNTGGLDMHMSSAVVNDTDIANNRAAQHAGGLFAYGSFISMTDSSIVSNTAVSDDAGGMWLIEGCTVHLVGCSLDNNSAAQGGGAIDADDALISLERTGMRGNSASESGGAMNVTESEVLIEDSTISDNTGKFGGGLGIGGGSVITLTDSTLDHNESDYGGGLILSEASRAILVDATLQYNTAITSGGAIGVYGGSRLDLSDGRILTNTVGSFGGGIDASQAAELVIEGTTISDNTAGDSGGGINAYGGGGVMPVTVHTSIVRGNAATANNAGGIWIGEGAELDLENTLIADNESGNCCAGVQIYKGAATVMNATVAHNESPTGGSGFFVDFGGQAGRFVKVTNSILWDNAPGDFDVINAGLSAYSVTYSDVEHGFVPGTGNISADPAFLDAAGQDYHLTAGPAVDSGTSSDAPVTDLDGNARPSDGNGDNVAEWDMGAYELTSGGRVFLPIIMMKHK